MHDFRYVGNKLYCEGVAIETLARKFGTPLYVYSQRTLTHHFQKLDRAMAPVDHLVCFAMKSNSNQSVLRAIANLGGGSQIALFKPFLFPIAVGDTFTALPGCDHTTGSCQTLFDNLARYGGFPHIPPPEAAA